MLKITVNAYTIAPTSVRQNVCKHVTVLLDALLSIFYTVAHLVLARSVHVRVSRIIYVLGNFNLNEIISCSFRIHSISILVFVLSLSFTCIHTNTHTLSLALNHLSPSINPFSPARVHQHCHRAHSFRPQSMRSTQMSRCL